LYVDVLWLVTCMCLDSFWAAVSAFLCLACSSSAEHCYCFIKCFFEQMNKQTNKQIDMFEVTGFSVITLSLQILWWMCR